MLEGDLYPTDRRTFLQAGALAMAGALGTSAAVSASSQVAATKPMELPLDFARLLPKVDKYLA